MFLIKRRSIFFPPRDGWLERVARVVLFFFFPAAAQLHNCGMGSWVGTRVRACMLFYPLKLWNEIGFHRTARRLWDLGSLRLSRVGIGWSNQRQNCKESPFHSSEPCQNPGRLLARLRIQMKLAECALRHTCMHRGTYRQSGWRCIAHADTALSNCGGGGWRGWMGTTGVVDFRSESANNQCSPQITSINCIHCFCLFLLGTGEPKKETISPSIIFSMAENLKNAVTKSCPEEFLISYISP